MEHKENLYRLVARFVAEGLRCGLGFVDEVRARAQPLCVEGAWEDTARSMARYVENGPKRGAVYAHGRAPIPLVLPLPTLSHG